MHAPNSGLVELTVEDPAPGMQALRDSCDLEWCLKQTGSLDVDLNSTSTSGSANNTSDAARFLDELSGKLRITQAQVEYLQDLTQFARLQAKEESNAAGVGAEAAATAAGDEEVAASWRTFRLRVKRRLLREQPDLRTLDKVKMQQELEELYAEQKERFERGCKNRKRLLEKVVAA